MLALPALAFLVVVIVLVLLACMRRATPVIAGAVSGWLIWLQTHDAVATASTAVVATASISGLLDHLAEQTSLRGGVFAIEATCSAAFAMAIAFAVLHSSGVQNISLVLAVAGAGVIGLGAWLRFRLGY